MKGQDTKLRELEKERNEYLKRTENSSIIALGFGVAGLAASILGSWMDFDSTGVGNTAGIILGAGLIVWGLSLRDKEKAAQKELKYLDELIDRHRKNFRVNEK